MMSAVNVHWPTEVANLQIDDQMERSIRRMAIQMASSPAHQIVTREILEQVTLDIEGEPRRFR
jgi:hypothetical protein